MTKTYSVWIDIEEYDEETDDYMERDAPGSALRRFDTYQEAWKYAQDVTNLVNGAKLPEMAPTYEVEEEMHCQWPCQLVKSNGKWMCAVDPQHEVVVSLPPNVSAPTGYCRTCVQIRRANAPLCPVCGIPQGFAPGTGDCGCELDP